MAHPKAGGDAVLILHCPKCDAIFEAHDDAHFETTCPRCGRVVRTGAKITWLASSAERNGGQEIPEYGQLLGANYARDSRLLLAGRPGMLRWTKNVAVRLAASTCPQCGRKVRRGMIACPDCGLALTKQPIPRLSQIGHLLRKVLLRGALFVGVPAAVIVFLVVVCAPDGNDVGQNAARSAPNVRGVESVPQTKTMSAVVKRGPASVLRSFKMWLRGSEHDSSPPAQSPLAGAHERAEKSNPKAEEAGIPDGIKQDRTH